MAYAPTLAPRERARASAHACDAERYPPISDYALIGDGRGAALVARDGAVDWLCWPRFDSPAIFSALLDRANGGHFRVQPNAEFEVERRYLPGTNVLETTFLTAAGSCALRDMLTAPPDDEPRTHLRPEQELLREIEGLSGEMRLRVEYAPRPDYGRLMPQLDDRGALGIFTTVGLGALILRTEPALECDGTLAHGEFTLRAGERVYLSLSYAEDGPATLPVLGAAARARVEQTSDWWSAWAARCTYQGPYRTSVERSALALKLLTFAPSGAIVAAPTTSLPEARGGAMNWDYRYCWLRDASLTLRALFGLGYSDEAQAFVDWLLHATRLTQPELQVLYDVYGRADIPERELPQLAGYDGARPVRVGNAAASQFQLDVYGEVVDGVWQHAARGGRFDHDTTRLLAGIGSTVCERWREPDAGIWEERDALRHYTHSRALCWVALDRLIALHEQHGLRVPAERFRRERAAIRAEIEERGFNQHLNSYTRTLDGDEVDASLLSLPLYGYVSADAPRMRGTIARIQERLATGELVYRREQREEASFGICAFWLVECLAMSGDLAGATAAFEQLLTRANDVGLFAEEIEADTGAALGNFPQAFTHVGLINAALALQRALDGV
jgi:GH15 family glucan-1,4-alpha-glucosidase